MKKILILSLALWAGATAKAQITITSADMPVSGDSLRYSFANPVGSTINLADTGTGLTWSFGLTPIRQGVDNYKSALSVSPLYALISFSAYGYKVADSLPGLSSALPVSINDIYTFFERSSSKFEAVAFAAKIATIPTPANYTKKDVWYRFPLTYTSSDSNDFSLTFSLSGLGSMKQEGYRKSRVDAWGTIVTPYHTSPVGCIRVRSEIREIDTVAFGSTKIGIPRNSVEYKWLVNGDHYPALWVTTNLIGSTETIATIRYRDVYRDVTVGVGEVTTTKERISALANPVLGNTLVLQHIPATWQQYTVAVYDMQSRLVTTVTNTATIDVATLPTGSYIAVVQAGNEQQYVRFAK